MTAARAAAVVIVLAAAVPAPAALRATFRPGWCAGVATHIVVTDRTGKVLESWVGDLKPGDTVPVDKFRLKLEQEIPGGGFWPGAPKDYAERKMPAKVSGNRLILFLARGRWLSPEHPPVEGWGSAHHLRGGFDVSAAWVEDGSVFGRNYTGLIPSPVELVYFGTEAAVKKEVLDLIALYDKYLEKAKAEKNPAAKVEQLVWFIEKKTRLTGPAFDELATCGEAGLKAVAGLRRELDSPDIAARVIRTLHRFGPAAKGELMRWVRGQLGTWNRFGGWLVSWDDARQFLRTEYDELLLLLEVPANFADLTAADRDVLAELAFLFAGHPVLSTLGKEGDRVSDRIAAVLDRPRK